MATIKRNSSNQDFTNNADGFDLSGGTTTKRKITVSGADVTVTGGGNATMTFPVISQTLLGTDTFRIISLAADAASNSTVTPAIITGLDLTVGAGTYTFQYFIRYQSAVTTTGVRFSVNHAGTLTAFLANMRWVDLSATASTAVPTQAGVIAAGQVVGAMSARLKSTAGWGTTLSVDVANGDMLMIIEGMMIVTASGVLSLYHGSEVAAASTVKAGSSLVLTKVG